jgi:3D (Asp-Asp-Asp) domain-containing protein
MDRLHAFFRPISQRLFRPAEGGIEETLARDKTRMRQFSFAALFALTACATASAPTNASTPLLSPYITALAFSLPEPDAAKLGPDLELWATHYHTPIVTPAPKEMSAAFPLIDRQGKWISAPLRHRDWCEAALQGSVSVRTGAKSTAYVFVDANGPEQANCDQYLGNLSEGIKTATRRARFMPVTYALGCGVRSIPLVPFRTIAVDPDVIPLESVLYVPELRGIQFEYDGKTYTHDGYLFAGDRGGAIRGKHIDVFMIDDGFAPFEKLFASTNKRTFSAYLVPPDTAGGAGVKQHQAGQCKETSGN